MSDTEAMTQRGPTNQRHKIELELKVKQTMGALQYPCLLFKTISKHDRRFFFPPLKVFYFLYQLNPHPMNHSAEEVETQGHTRVSFPVKCWHSLYIDIIKKAIHRNRYIKRSDF